MFSKTGMMALCAAFAMKEVAAGHGHERLHANKNREVVYAATETVYLTDVVTVTVTEVQQATAAANFAPSIKAHQPGHVKPQTTAAHAVVKPTSKPHHTTLVTAVKPQPSATKTGKTPRPSTYDTSIKRGLAYNDISLVQTYLDLGGQAGWAYNWDSAAWADVPGGLAFYPMLWSPAPEHSDQWNQNAADAIARGVDALLSFNEPDIATQANMSPQDAASGHMQWMNPFAGQARISAPAVSSSENAGQGADWLRQFFSACGGQCQVDFCAAHWYGPGGDEGAGLFLNHLKDMHDACEGKPIWVTEFAALDGDKDQFMRNILSNLETNEEFSFVERYSYFYAALGELFDSPTELSSFGKIYAGIA
ncbi:glycosyl hydrolase catalytic core-domain-containing protein [Poronia punctata]|nr:glycosyl hydrolase catalytic core-domain-containing protein [Poronia punctata]